MNNMFANHSLDLEFGTGILTNKSKCFILTLQKKKKNNK